MNYIAGVSVMTDAKVPISTATEAGSIQASYCRAITSFSAGDSDAINTAVPPTAVGTVPSTTKSEHDQRMDQEFHRNHRRHFPGRTAERTQRHGLAEHKQRRRRRGVLQK
jgi:hypothetical protein